MINSALTHRADIRRAVVTVTDGSPSSTWSTVSTGVPCFVSPDEVSMDPTWTREQQQAAAMTGTVLFPPGVDIRPGDVIVLTRPAAGLSFSIGQDVRPILDQRRIHHWEASVTQISEVVAA